MTNLELFMNAVNAMEGLDVSLKIGKESELVIKGDFMKIANAIGTVIQAETADNNARRQIQELEERLIK